MLVVLNIELYGDFDTGTWHIPQKGLPGGWSGQAQLITKIIHKKA